MLNRRSFLTAMAGITAGAELDLDRLLWKPKLISIPKPGPVTVTATTPWSEDLYFGGVKIVTRTWIPRDVFYFVDPALLDAIDHSDWLAVPQAKYPGRLHA